MDPQPEITEWCRRPDCPHSPCLPRPQFESPTDRCTVPPEGWTCTRAAGHDGPCAAWPVAVQNSQWATVWQYLTGRRCQAVAPPNPSGLWGRCDLAAGHPGDHALERGLDHPRWSTEWTG